jgi:hypothetical protein
MDQYHLVTSMSIKQYRAFGENMIVSMNSYLPDNSSLTVFIDDFDKFDDLFSGERIEYQKLDTNLYDAFSNVATPLMSNVVTAERNSDEYDTNLMFKWDATRFAYKIYSIFQALQSPKGRYLIWIDADTKATKNIDNQFFPSLLIKGDYMAYLSRTERHSECGFVMFDTQHPIHYYFWNAMSGMYNGLLIFSESEWHDSYIFDVLRESFERYGIVANTKIHETQSGHVWNESRLKTEAGLEHFKGPLDGK